MLRVVWPHLHPPRNEEVGPDYVSLTVYIMLLIVYASIIDYYRLFSVTSAVLIG